MRNVTFQKTSSGFLISLKGLPVGGTASLSVMGYNSFTKQWVEVYVFKDKLMTSDTYATMFDYSAIDIEGYDDRTLS